MGSSTTVVSLFTTWKMSRKNDSEQLITSILCSDISMLTSTEKYSVMLGEPSYDE